MNNPWIAQQRAVFADEVAAHKTEIAAMLLSEGTPEPTCESLIDRTLLMRANGHPDYTLMQMLHSGFYGPINKLGLPHLVAVVNSNPRAKRNMFAAIDEAMAGSDTIEGFTDQGLKTDPNGWRTPRLDMGGNVFNDWDGGRIGHVKAEAWRQGFETSALQSALNIVGRAPNGFPNSLKITGQMDAVTKDALMVFQQDNPPLQVDGIYGPKTRVAINAKLAAAA